ncbi:MAG: Zn-dependent hydrolase of the beta-lactamase fold-like protein [Candidatus Gottesmanbacteria bacterium GW2011_GWA2_47_9]|uniref:Zn-dependent hydrolase of the beta-lactamase fold-like protein n=1 Tax=Candidatus Gottesmanbacteria bacterium GW2011_GWA2_47_9 TaxID=1618445 RepID=A0A0G1W788_9BACT|nr:MAG: Zn-dependent hydrolase of the beta-lactamase fold-like protein [Candidatus Gottesmanbacteria bacterium GW2011_GWA2_47_9]
MDITYLGHSSFKLRGKNATVVTDSYDPAMVGLKFPKHIEADIVTVSHDHQDHNAGKNTMYRIELDGVAIVHLGDIGDTLTSAQVDNLDGVDVLFIPVGGVYTIDATKAVAIIHEVEPSIVVPMHYGRPELNQKAFGELAPVAAFLKEIGKEGLTAVSKLALTKDKIPEEMQVVVFE